MCFQLSEDVARKKAEYTKALEAYKITRGRFEEHYIKGEQSASCGVFSSGQTIDGSFTNHWFEWRSEGISMQGVQKTDGGNRTQQANCLNDK